MYCNFRSCLILYVYIKRLKVLFFIGNQHRDNYGLIRLNFWFIHSEVLKKYKNLSIYIFI